jgi:16S rRNA (adenine1518-N6/adenine1519-N6)-dimethyltransferase
LAKLADLVHSPTSLHVLLQLEMAERLTANVGTKEYGSLTARLAIRYASSIVRRVPHGVFFPPPEIDSAFLRMTRLPQETTQEVLKRADALINAAFAQRRKQARRLLAGVAPDVDWNTALAQLGLPETVRAEDISPRQYLTLAMI